MKTTIDATRILRTALLSASLLTFSAVADELPALEANDCTPAGELRGDASRGEEIHLENCAECHGYDGKAEVIVMHMDEPPKDQSDPQYMKTMADAYIYISICKGGDAVGKSIVMPGWGDVLTDQEIKDLVAQIRSFSGT
jgi:cytochrome c oxidase cbb3-type subunit 3